jgi:hypothetical protein
MNPVGSILEEVMENESSLLLKDLSKNVATASKLGFCPIVNFEVLSDQPICLALTPETGECKKEVEFSLVYIARKLSNSDLTRKFLFRGVKLERLESVVTSGCDVTPTTARIFATDTPSKALEYGEVIMVFDATKLVKTFVEVPKSESTQILNRLRSEYPTELEKGGSLWFSKLPPEDFRVGTLYEGCYSYYIPGDAREALLMIFLVGDDKHKLLSEYVRHTNKPLPPKLQAELADWERKQHEIQIKKEALLAKVRNRKSPTTSEI